MAEHWHGVTVYPPNALGIVQPQVTPATNWSRAQAKREMQPMIRAGQGQLRYRHLDGSIVEPADWWLEHEPLMYMPLAEGAAMAAVMPCRGDCMHTAAAFIQDWVETLAAAGMPNIEMQTSKDDVTGIMDMAVPHRIAGKQYPQPLPPELARWYAYPSDSGHSIVVLIEDPQPDWVPADLAMLLVPVPVRTVQRLGYRMHQGFVVCTGVECDPDLGVITPAGDEEW